MNVRTPADLAELIRRREARLGRTRLVAIDGPAGSGKTTLAATQHELLPGSVILHMDDVYRGWDTDFDEVHQRLRAQVLEPLAEGRGSRYQRYDWYAEAFADWIDVPVPDVLLLEGVGSGSRAVDAVLSLLVWVEVRPDLRIQRGVERDGEAVRPKWLAWMEHERLEHRRQDTRSRADLRLTGDAASGELSVLQPDVGS